MADKVEWMPSNKKQWTEEHWRGYRSLPWLGRRLADLYSLFPFVNRWVRRKGERMIAKYDADFEKNERGWQEARKRDQERKREREEDWKRRHRRK